MTVYFNIRENYQFTALYIRVLNFYLKVALLLLEKSYIFAKTYLKPFEHRTGSNLLVIFFYIFMLLNNFCNYFLSILTPQSYPKLASKARRPKNDRMEVINEDDQMSNAKTSKLSDSASDEGFNSGNQSPEPEERKRERRRNNRDESKKRRRNHKNNNPITKI